MDCSISLPVISDFDLSRTICRPSTDPAATCELMPNLGIEFQDSPEPVTMSPQNYVPMEYRKHPQVNYPTPAAPSMRTKCAATFKKDPIFSIFIGIFRL